MITGNIQKDMQRTYGKETIGKNPLYRKRSEALSSWSIELVSYLSNGYTVEEVSKVIPKSRRTIETHIAMLKEDFEAKNTPHLVAIFLRKQLIK